jgi:hypothetical protein
VGVGVLRVKAEGLFKLGDRSVHVLLI